ncbi:hypothetical protein A3A46_02730 [Candidatus Roizmanbacteria bacterium RIFCSPLOWO2_01_FULL_37_13]|uniref:Helix-hairpin-helix DNA-binding motif class 1 domain-containing protein n=1 Tax=Candidatus Roizmanbacteria bacterium RIFCSPHIGHO2_02_FULL_38_11 TaxID=1802039 RepID=A0A1F7H495_9BACT|nr:MAG: hypothetical protein A3C25_00190 [Candidatus Roizmanbacteria bacterium RIFCSPHIGHO2_02_FULL_38_11]OGK34082.1 MAG: hypothetical protein A3F58_01300 [Candidatus Roizmanbacteria bacterium RIFCSPHIGHO2_12_FULL_37_9b]OGK43040.1 MAG: hypothetical protein A3A46_02730 [Candidatus Roizmanbacteria bacterium RIFCSPLOWO2_01_FULL_37_13]
MQGLIESLKPIWEKYKIEFFLISTALVISLISGIIFINNHAPTEETDILEPVKTDYVRENKIIVDLSGAVEKPDVYEISSGARLKDVLILAGDLSAEADRQFFARNFNLARRLNDQEKVYIPSSEEIENGTMNENNRTLIINQSQIAGVSTENAQNSKINVNSASMSELDSLPGIGKVTAQKIIQNRPYESTEDLLNKKIVGKSVFEKIKELIQF